MRERDRQRDVPLLPFNSPQQQLTLVVVLACADDTRLTDTRRWRRCLCVSSLSPPQVARAGNAKYWAVYERVSDAEAAAATKPLFS